MFLEVGKAAESTSGRVLVERWFSDPTMDMD